MDKLEELEKALRAYQELLKNAMMDQYGQPAEATIKSEKLDDGKMKEEEKKEDGKMKEEEKKEEEKDEKKDKKLIERMLNEHDKKQNLKKSIEVINFNNNSQWSIDD